jgi:hypothetical protein
MRLRDALEPLAGAFAFDLAERDGLPTLIARDGATVAELDEDALALPEEGEALDAARTLDAPPDELRLRFIDEAADYQTGALTVRRDPADAGDVAVADLPMVMTAPRAEQVGRRLLARSRSARDETILRLSPLAALRLEPGDRVRLHDDERVWRVEQVALDETPHATLSLAEAAVGAGGEAIDWTPPSPGEPAAPPVLHILDLPPLPGAEDDARPLIAAAVEPWRDLDIHAGVSAEALTVRARVDQPAAVGETLSDLPAGPLHRLHQAGRLTVRLEGATLESRPLAAVLAGANALAVLGAGGAWEILQFLGAEAIEPDVWSLSGVLRGQAGSEPAMADLLPVGAPVVLLGDGLVRAQTALSERGLPLLWRAGPAGGPAGGEGVTETQATWRALALRPWSPCHLTRTALTGGDIVFSWIRRARLSGDSLDGEPPLSEEAERYRIELLDGESVVRVAETAAPSFLWTAAMQAADFPGGVPDPVSVRVAQISATFGPGAALRRAL